MLAVFRRRTNSATFDDLKYFQKVKELKPSTNAA
jgi:hypothetical protein